jgi:hypothetical protein
MSILVLALWTTITPWLSLLFLLIFTFCQSSPYFIVVSSFAASFGGRKYSVRRKLIKSKKGNGIWFH